MGCCAESYGNKKAVASRTLTHIAVNTTQLAANVGQGRKICSPVGSGRDNFLLRRRNEVTRFGRLAQLFPRIGLPDHDSPRKRAYRVAKSFGVRQPPKSRSSRSVHAIQPSGSDCAPANTIASS